MKSNATRLLAATPLLALALHAGAAEMSASSASSAGSASLGSSSDSLRTSSNSSSRNNQVAEGDYRIVDVAEVAERPGVLKLTLAAIDASAPADAGFELLVPQAALAPRGAARGDVIAAKHRPYGLEFSRGDTREAFFLVLADAWHGQLDARAVPL